MKYFLIFCALICLVFSAGAQDKYADSLRTLLSTAPPVCGKSSDTVNFKISLELSKYYETRNSDSLQYYLSALSDTVFTLQNPVENKSLYRLKSEALKTLGNLNKNQKNFKIALGYYEQSLKLARFIGNNELIARNLFNIGNIWGDMGNLDKTIEKLMIALDFAEKNNVKEFESKSLNSLGKKYIIKGDYSTAITFYERSLAVSREMKNEQQVRSTCIVLGEAYSNLRTYSKSKLYYEEAMNISRKSGKKSDICTDLTNMGRISYYLEDFEEAKKHYFSAIDLARELKWIETESTCFIGLGSCCVGERQFDEAVKYFESAAEIGRKNKNDVLVLSCLANLGIISYYQGNYEKAIEYQEESIEGFVRLNSVSDLPYEYFKLAHTSFLAGNIEKSYKAYVKSRDLFLAEFRNSFAFLGESEKEENMKVFRSVFMQMNGFNSRYANEIDSLSQLCYDNELIFKGLMLKSSKAMADVIRNSSDTTLLNTYEKLKQLRNLFSEARSSGNTEMAKNLEMQATETEHKLANLCIQYADIKGIFDISWKEVQKTLKKGEAAIEFSHYYLNDNKSKIYYVAFLITDACKEPLTIKLFMEEDLNELTVPGENSYHQIQKLYGTKDRLNDRLYEIIWQPVEQHLKGIQTVYYAPSGILNNISFASIGKGDSLLCDRYNLVQLSSTGKLIHPETGDFGKKTNAAVFGGINFNAPEKIPNAAAGNWDYLPGTLNELNLIVRQLKKNGVKVTGFSGNNAAERDFKNLYAEKGSGPQILHLATHGFFFPDPEQVNKQNESDDQLVEYGDVVFRGSGIAGASYFITNPDPMKRSGLVFAGANNINPSMVSDTASEGILTAGEVSQLNMSQTSLVVLSACETGLGDIKGSEGVFGLQRAFKMAGVHFIVMSLWQVPDKETEEFMTDLYDRFLKTKDIRSAFSETQKSMRQKYDPYFWGAFVLFE